MKSSGIGGQAVIEGVMMRNQDMYAVAVRTPDQKIEIKKEKAVSLHKKSVLFRLPIVRGVVAFIDSMYIGMKTLTYSSSFYEEEEEEQQTKVEQGFSKVFKDKAEAVIMGITVCLSVIMAVGIFMILPFFLAGLCEKMTTNVTYLALIEGGIRVAIFLIYMFAISRMKDIRRVFMYHGAEHKTINCVENGLPLSVENVRGQSRYHKRCGTSFMFLVIFLSVIFFIFLHFDTMWLRLVSRILLVPLIAGIAYEFIRLAGRSNSRILTFLSKPGMWFQSLTTREPEDDMIEVAIASVEAVFDWKNFQEEQGFFVSDSSDGVSLVDLDVVLEEDAGDAPSSVENNPDERGGGEEEAAEEENPESLEAGSAVEIKTPSKQVKTAGKDRKGQERTSREMAGQEKAGREKTSQETAGQERTGRETSGQKNAGPETNDSETFDFEAEDLGSVRSSGETLKAINSGMEEEPLRFTKAAAEESEEEESETEENGEGEAAVTNRKDRTDSKDNVIAFAPKKEASRRVEPTVLIKAKTVDRVNQAREELRSGKKTSALEALSKNKVVVGPEAGPAKRNSESGVKSVKRAKDMQEAVQARKSREQALILQEKHSRSDKDKKHASANLLAEEEDDEILRALDKYFVLDEEKKDE